MHTVAGSQLQWKAGIPEYPFINMHDDTRPHAWPKLSWLQSSSPYIPVQPVYLLPRALLPYLPTKCSTFVSLSL